MGRRWALAQAAPAAPRPLARHYLACLCFAAILLGAHGQGYIPPSDLKLGAREVKQEALRNQYDQAAALQKSFTSSKRAAPKLGPCTRGSGGSLCGAAAGGGAGAGVALQIATSPSAFASTDPRLTGGLQLFAPPEDQGACNTCTALSVAALAQAAAAAALRANASAALGLSAADLYYCSPAERRTCSAGFGLKAALQELQARAPSLRTAACLPYGPAAAAAEAGAGGECQALCDGVSPLAKQGRFTLVPIATQPDAQRHIRLHGGVATSFMVHPDFKSFFARPANKNVVYNIKSSDKPSTGFIWHAIVLVGYNSKGGYWLARNSWGTSFAADGYFKVAFECCGLLDEAFGLTWEPNDPQLLPRLSFKPAPGRPSCSLYTGQPGDYLSTVAARAGVPLLQLVLDNEDRLAALDQALASTEVLFLDGISNSGRAYRLYKAQTANWMYAEKFASQGDAEAFCRAAGGTLGVPASSAETADAERLLRSALAGGVRSAYDVPAADFIVWMGLRLTDDPMAPWQSMRGPAALNGYANWAPSQPARRDGHACSVLGLSWPSGATAWFSYACGWSNMGLAALCKLPPGEDVSFPKGVFPAPPQPAPPAFKGLSINTAYNEFSFKSPSTGRLVTIYAQPRTWDDAAADCAARGAALFVPEAPAGLQELGQATAAAIDKSGLPDLHRVWLGVEKAAGSDVWAAAPAGAEAAGRGRRAVAGGLLRWEPNEPNGAGREERACVLQVVFSALRHGAWVNDHTCDVKEPYVCVR
ncbi:MAG: hypothetical protein J3K34DRAFT_516360 [Monoraphidium minutum]|nr:MAG: hypothetical protein J3K34DRAFT_516360 [Monoraphidium minutum]